jgi:hypothetical protein
MGVVNHPRTYDPVVMTTLKAAFHDVWEVLDRGPVRDKSRDNDLKAAIVRQLLELVENGTTSREELKTRVLRSLPLR